MQWKDNWEETQNHFIDWWARKGVVLGTWGAQPAGSPIHEPNMQKPQVSKPHEQFFDPDLRARLAHYSLACMRYPLDCLPLTAPDVGPGTLGLFLGCEAEFDEKNIWYKPCIDPDNPEDHPEIRFNPDTFWWNYTERTLRRSIELGRGKYLVGCPDLIENIDTLAAMRESQLLLFDMIERPEWVDQKLQEINTAWIEAFQRIYDITHEPDGSSSFGAFRIWGPGKTAKLQSDASAMISPEMFERFVAPMLTEQCQYLDHSIYHLDGTQAMVHLDLLLEIEELDAIEWTPQAGIEGGCDPRWYPLYRQIIEGGKSVQVMGGNPSEVRDLLNAVGTNGLYIFAGMHNDETVEELRRIRKQFTGK
ncbi:MAG: hypothetical protein ACOCWJ_01360 [Verrucomicrobiota bacterium]